MIEKWNALSKGGKWLVAIIILAILGIISSAVDGDSTSSPPSSSTTTSTSSSKDRDCAERGSDLADEMGSLGTRAESLSPYDSASIRSIVRDARSTTARGRSFVTDCGYLAPASASNLSDSLDTLDSSIDEIESWSSY